MEPQLNEIPMERWSTVLDQFSRGHHGQLSELVIVTPDSGRHQQARDLPLLGISAEPTVDGQRITIVAASTQGAHVSHEVEHPTRVRLAEWNDGVSAELEIDGADGYSARVRVGPAEQTIPEGAILDGYFPRT